MHHDFWSSLGHHLPNKARFQDHVLTQHTYRLHGQVTVTVFRLLQRGAL
jgi:hypothetical protein